MKARPRPRSERMRTRPRPKIFVEAEAEARHIREQLSVYEHKILKINPGKSFF